jgi:putative addiction module component (TIGR02574 family)
MLASRDDILDAALRLSEDDRMLIVGRLLETLPAELPGWSMDDPELEAELERRSGDWEGAIPWEQLREEIRRSP